MTRLQKLFLNWMLIASFLLSTGCGGGLSNKDLLERAKAAQAARGNDDDETPAKNVSPSPTAVAKADPAATSGSINGKAEIPILASAEPLLPVSLTAQQREEKTVENLTRISQALETYAKEHSAYPAVAMYSAQNPLLSWRVALLPYLGYEDLYKNFNLDEPWDSDHNLQLLPYIPEPYRSPNRADYKTNYLVPQGTFTAFPGAKSTMLVRVEDGPTNTVVLAEASDKLAAEWTRPLEWRITQKDLVAGVASDVAEGFYVAWGGGRISKLRADLTDPELYAILSIDGSEVVSLSELIAMDAGDLAADLIDRGQADLTKLDTQAVAAKSDPTGQADVASGNKKTSPSQNAAGENFAAAVDALSKGNQRQAFELYYASLLLQSNNDAVLHDYHWIPALKRPVAGLRWGIGVDSMLNERISQDVDPIEIKNSTSAKRISGPGVGLVDHFCGDLGQRVLRDLDQRAENGELGSLAASTTANANDNSGGFNLKSFIDDGFEPVMLRPGVEVLGVGNRSVMLKTAKRREVDVLVLFDVSVKMVSNNAIHNTTTIQLIDVENGNSLYETKPLNNISVARARKDPTKEDPLIEELGALKEFVDNYFSLQDLPDLLPAHVQNRIAILLKTEPRNPLKNMAEVRFYLAHGLISGYEAMKAIKDMAGAEGDNLPGLTKDLQMEHLQKWISSEGE